MQNVAEHTHMQHILLYKFIVYVFVLRTDPIRSRHIFAHIKRGFLHQFWIFISISQFLSAVVSIGPLAQPPGAVMVSISGSRGSRRVDNCSVLIMVAASAGGRWMFIDLLILFFVLS